MGGVSRRPKGCHDNFFWSKQHQKWIQRHQISQSANFQPNQTTFKKITIRGLKKGVFWIQKPPRKGVFWIFGQKTKTPLLYIYGGKASWKKLEKSDARFQRYSLKQPFLPKKGVFWIQKPPWGLNKNFSPKSENVTSVTFISHNFVQKIRKIWCADFEI